MIRSVIGEEILVEPGNSMEERLLRLIKPRPPSLTGRARSARSMSDGAALPVKAGMSLQRKQFTSLA